MPSRRSALFMLGSIAAGGLGLVSTGAFSTVEASRTATVNTAGDANALLGITPGPGGGQFVENTGDTVDIDIQDVNKNAITAIDQLLEVTNNGTEKVTVGFVAEYAADKAGGDGDFDESSGEVPPYGYTYATNDATNDDKKAALVMWASPKEDRMDDTYAEVRPELLASGFEGSSGSSLVDNISSRDEVVDTINGGTRDPPNGRKIDPGESVNIGLVIDTRDNTTDTIDGPIADALDSNINLVAEITENVS